MSTIAAALATAERRELAAKKKHVEIQHVPTSDLPYRILKRNTGVLLHHCRMEGEVDIFLQGVTLESLSAKPTSRRVKR